jgi:hypothetical protein
MTYSLAAIINASSRSLSTLFTCQYPAVFMDHGQTGAPFQGTLSLPPGLSVTVMSMCTCSIWCSPFRVDKARAGGNVGNVQYTWSSTYDLCDLRPVAHTTTEKNK